MQQTDLGTEAQCAKCLEYWPADEEFFYMRHGKPHSWCKACYLVAPSVLAKRSRWLDKLKTDRAASAPAH
jgi:hypothetical protein